MRTAEKVKTDAMYPAAFPTPPLCPSTEAAERSFGTNLKNRPETFVLGLGLRRHAALIDRSSPGQLLRTNSRSRQPEENQDV
jgi:hypothetical protein